MKSLLLLACLVAAMICPSGCNNTIESPTQLAQEANAAERKAAATAVAWSLKELDKVPLAGQPAANEVANLLQKGSTAAVAYLASPAAKTTADNVNTYLKDLLFASIPAPIVLALDTAATILDKLGVEPDKMIEQAALDTLTAFASGVGDGVAQFRAGKIPAAAPAAPVTTRAFRFWLHAMPKPKSGAENPPSGKGNPADSASEYVPPDNLLGRTYVQPHREPSWFNIISPVASLSSAGQRGK